MSDLPQTGRLPATTLGIAAVAVAGIALHLVLVAGPDRVRAAAELPLLVVLAVGGVPLVIGLGRKLLRGELGADLLAGISIVTAGALGEYLAGAIVVLMLSGGEALEQFALRRASSVLRALAARMPSVAHRPGPDGPVEVPIESVGPGDEIVVLPHQLCPVDGVVLDGHGDMDESYLTGEPYVQSKAPGSSVLSGAVNGERALTVRATRRARDSRYAEIMEVMRRTEESRPRLRRLGDRLGAIYTPVAIAVALGAYFVSGSATRALSVLVVATPCPLILAIPVAIIGGISLAARRGIVVRDPAVLERLDGCRTAIFDKTGTLTYGKPVLTEVVLTASSTREEALALAAGLEQYSKHPLAVAILTAAKAERVKASVPDEIAEPPGGGLSGTIGGRRVALVGRRRVDGALPPAQPGLESVLTVDGAPVALFRFRDEPREDSRFFVEHLRPQHGVLRVMLVSGDRTAEVEDLARRVGITEVRGGQSPEDKVRIVREEVAKAPTLFIGDGINDAPAIAAATVGLAFGRGNDVIAEAAGAVLLDTNLVKVDELFHIARRLRRIALESAIVGMALSAVGMGLAAAGWLSPVAGAVFQEIIDVLAIANALRAARAPAHLHDYQGRGGFLTPTVPRIATAVALALMLAPAVSAETISQADAEKAVRAAMTDLESIRGLAFKRAVPVSVVDDAKARAYALARFKKLTPEAKILADTKAYQLLGLVPPGTDILKTMLDVLEEQAGGFYDPQTKSFFLLDDMPKAMTGPLTVHEMTHALEDQHYDIDGRLAKVLDDDDAAFAISALAEGSASLTMGFAMARDMAAGTMDAEAFQAMAESEAGRAEQLDAMPGVLRAQLLGPYILGALFLARGDLAAASGYPKDDANAAWADLPRSSEQILHPEKYWDRARRDEPKRVAVPDAKAALGDGWTKAGEGVLGELTLGGLVGVVAPRSQDHKALADAAPWTNAAATGWGGDRFVLWTKGSEAVVLLLTRWDRAADAVEFESALRSDRPALALRREGQDVAIVAGGDAAARGRLLDLLLPPPAAPKP